MLESAEIASMLTPAKAGLDTTLQLVALLIAVIVGYHAQKLVGKVVAAVRSS